MKAELIQGRVFVPAAEQKGVIKFQSAEKIVIHSICKYNSVLLCLLERNVL